jgi:hypothetical protein
LVILYSKWGIHDNRDEEWPFIGWLKKENKPGGQLSVLSSVSKMFNDLERDSLPCWTWIPLSVKKKKSCQTRSFSCLTLNAAPRLAWLIDPILTELTWICSPFALG